ncbi:MAG TPA: hypothetical protein VJ022_07350 [Anaerolineales bacterium]|nr:hypothetical protein [Anaerolineales bacterium]
MSENISVRVSLPKKAYQALKRVAKKKHKSESDILLDALRAYLDQLAKVDPLLGMFADETDLMDEVLTYAMQTRESTPLRVHEGK